MFIDRKIVVTMTSWKKRIHNCASVINSILGNSILPDVVYLNLSLMEFPKKEKELPNELLNVAKNPKVKINWISGPNTKTMKKVFPILKYLDDDDIIMTCDDDMLLPNSLIQSRLCDFFQHDEQCVISTSNRRSAGFKNMCVVIGNMMFTKKMLNGYEQFYVDKVVNTFHDDRFYQSMFYLNGYRTIGGSDFRVGGTCRCLNNKFKDVNGMTKSKGYLSSEKFDAIFRPLAEKKFKMKFEKMFGILKHEDTKSMDARDKNIKYIDYWKGVYNLGDIFSDYLFEKMYDKSLLDKIADRKKMRFIGSEIPTKGWMDKNTLCCGMGWRVQSAKLNPNTVSPGNFCYVRGKISRQRVIQSGVKISPNLPIGDTGLLASLLYKPSGEKRYDIGIITHWSGAKNAAKYVAEAKKMYPDKSVKFVSMGNKNMNCIDLFEFISNCRVVLASSLHAIIFSHSFGVPVLYFSDVDSYKFKDYYSVFPRIDFSPKCSATIVQALKFAFNENQIVKLNPTKSEVCDIQATILNAMPYRDCFTEFGKNLVEMIKPNQSIIQGKPNENIHYFLMQNKNDDILLSSSSGGVIPQVVDYVISNGGSAFGVMFNDDFKSLKYVEIDRQNEKKVRGSKYIDVSVTDEVVEKIRTRLNEGRQTLFIGRPCQCMIMKKLFRDYKNLICLQISCFGVPCQDLWQKCVSYLVANHGEISNIDFRDKRFGWKKYHMTVTFKNGHEISHSVSNSRYMKQYISRKFLKSKCLNCRLVADAADIQCADAWGSEQLMHDDNRGRSIVITYTDIGNHIIDAILNEFNVIKINENQLLKLKSNNRGLRI